MEMWEIEGGLPLRGEVRVARAKNAVLPQMAAALLTEEPVRILNAPELTDVGRMAQMLIDLGGTVRSEGGALDIVCASPRAKASGAIEGLTRASVLALGPLLARCGEATLALPGGCRIGARPIDIHLSGFEAMGAQVSVQDGVVSARGRLHPARYRMKFPSVGATENIMMA
ncbi:MAG: UDP-N-acetylglucosamine 1-carboxyvinyltransferase, partial [Candidatus Fimadaptatus sp.]|nr:UDP-N-acetylglucosamine 1-carboxyvinyltransferase [Candidatus Fimadaptatus sp.]